MQLHRDIAKFEAKKIKIVAISPEKIKQVAKYHQKHQLSFDLVSDNQHLLGNKYGQQVILLKLGRMPAQIILNKNQAIIFKHYASSMLNIISNDKILNQV